jgi:hypothetical protein
MVGPSPAAFASIFKSPASFSVGHPFHNNAIAKLEDGLTMQRVHADFQATKESGESAVGHEP